MRGGNGLQSKNNVIDIPDISVLKWYLSVQWHNIVAHSFHIQVV